MFDDWDEEFDEEGACLELRRRADEIALSIVDGEYAPIDIVIRIRRLKEFVARFLPGRVALFRMIYENRFRRLWDQFRLRRDGPLPEW